MSGQKPAPVLNPVPFPGVALVRSQDHNSMLDPQDATSLHPRFGVRN
jgi:hypothetical protein